MIRLTNGQLVEIPRPSGKPLSGYLIVPSGDGPFPAVIVIHEVFGLNDQIKGMADEFVRSGYGALAVDLYSSGEGPRLLCMVRTVLGVQQRPFTSDAIADLGTALEYLGALPTIDRGRLGVIGFCLGGTLAMELACVEGRRPRAAAVFYGVNPRPLAAVARACPIVGSYPGIDWTTFGVQPLEDELASHDRKDDDIKVYPLTLHSFMNERLFSYNERAAQDAWARTMRFFDKHLAPTSSEGIARAL